jgi:hypothetical protein
MRSVSPDQHTSKYDVRGSEANAAAKKVLRFAISEIATNKLAEIRMLTHIRSLSN